MAPKKLSDSEKKEIVQLYNNPEESTSTLASRFGVSSSTISRVLKQGLSPDAYDALVQQKKTGGQSSHSANESSRHLVSHRGKMTDEAELQLPINTDTNDVVRSTLDQVKSSKPSELTEDYEIDEPSLDSPELSKPENSDLSDLEDDSEESNIIDFSPFEKEKPIRRRRKRSRPSSDVSDNLVQLPITNLTDIEDDETSLNDEPSWSKLNNYDPISDLSTISQEDTEEDVLVEVIDEDLVESEDDFEDDLDVDEDDEDEDFIDDDEVEPLQFKREDLVQIFPFSTADLPRTCYLVIDRSSELITRPLQDFGELGDIPSAELSENTLPVFDNHRIAKRFANRRTQRIVKIPDSRILRKTTTYLQSKGITRLLIDGHVYSLTE